MNEENIPLTDPIEMQINNDAEMPSTAPPNELESANESLGKALMELQEQKDKYLRLVAEFDNFKRRSAKERIELMQTAGKDVVVSLLEILDDMSRSEKQANKLQDADQLKEGNKLIFNKLLNILQQKGLSAMTSIGEEFNVEKHEAITEIEAGAEMKGKVVDELEKGYYLNEKIIRFAKVVVGK
jgi:molecular chaperone GrpE